MAHIEQVSEQAATGLLKRIYDAANERAGAVANIIRVMSQDAIAANGSMQFYVSLMQTENGLSGAQKELLATVVSGANDCFY